MSITMDQMKNLQYLVGETIKSIDDSSVNCITIETENGVIVVLEAESVGHGLVGIVPYAVSEVPKTQFA